MGDVAFHAVVSQSRPAAFASLQAVVQLLHPSSKAVDAAGCVNGVPDVIVNDSLPFGVEAKYALAGTTWPRPFC